jgi:hypothetical protein
MGAPAWPHTKEYRQLRKMLRGSGLEHEMRAGTKHVAVYLEGQKVLSLPLGAKMELDTMASAIRRAKERRCQKS